MNAYGLANASSCSDETLELLLTNTGNTSSRSSFGWVLLDQAGARLHHGSVMAGIETLRPSTIIDNYHDSIHHILLSSEPQSGAINTQAIINSIESSSCKHITLAHSYPLETADKTWTSWTSSWQGEIHTLSPSYSAARLASGISSIKTFNRPWVTVVSVNSFQNNSLPFISLRNEFGVFADVEELVRQCRCVIYCTSQKHVIDLLPDTNHMDEYTEFFEVNDAITASKILSYCASEFRGNALLFTDNTMLHELIDNNLVDEIIHHTVLTKTHDDELQPDSGFPDLPNWELCASSMLGNCNRVTLKRNLE